jgi:hypothetical protein
VLLSLSIAIMGQLTPTGSHLCADPTQDLSIDIRLYIHPPEQKERAQLLQGFDSGAFSCLPTEIIHRILSYLASRDVCSLRLASRSIAVVSDQDKLPPSFWASRFARGQEMSFVFAHLPVSSAINWQPWRELTVTVERRCKPRLALRASRTENG